MLLGMCGPAGVSLANLGYLRLLGVCGPGGPARLVRVSNWDGDCHRQGASLRLKLLQCRGQLQSRRRCAPHLGQQVHSTVGFCGK